MLTLPDLLNGPKHHYPLGKRALWHDGRLTASFGCVTCPDYVTCGGLRIPGALYDCLDNCCRKPEACDVVCRNKPLEFVQRVREVGGFSFDNVSRAQSLPQPSLPPIVPVLYHGNRREMPFAPPAVCLSLYNVIPRHDGRARYTDATAVAKAFRFRLGTEIILTGTDRDAPLERWWGAGTRRLEIISQLRDLGVTLVTTPNFSVFTDRPRWDDMHSMKRIAITHEEFLRMGMPAALHVNARTERDWERWTEYILRRDEVTHVASEFATGAGAVERVEWHATQLAKLAEGVNRPLHLIVRAASRNALARLVYSFAQTTVLDTMSFLKTVHRQKAVVTIADKIGWQPFPTVRNAPLDDLLQHNWSLVAHSYKGIFVH